MEWEKNTSNTSKLPSNKVVGSVTHLSSPGLQFAIDTDKTVFLCVFLTVLACSMNIWLRATNQLRHATVACQVTLVAWFSHHLFLRHSFIELEGNSLFLCVYRGGGRVCLPFFFTTYLLCCASSCFLEELWLVATGIVTCISAFQFCESKFWETSKWLSVSVLKGMEKKFCACSCCAFDLVKSNNGAEKQQLGHKVCHLFMRPVSLTRGCFLVSASVLTFSLRRINFTGCDYFNSTLKCLFKCWTCPYISQ